MKLYRAVGKAEYNLIVASGMQEFPERLPGQPFFYPVLTLQYAIEMSKWNDEQIVLEFEINREYLEPYSVQLVGASYHTELWIPAADLPEFNRNIVGKIERVDVAQW